MIVHFFYSAAYIADIAGIINHDLQPLSPCIHWIRPDHRIGPDRTGSDPKLAYSFA